jgi:8-oxo-dGTP pyrophosphatase MutT (NUDIX family)
MPLVPSSIQTIAANAAALQAANPINDCAGVQLAERLKAGTITDADVEKMHRFFAVNSRNVGFDEQCLRTADTSALVRSWELHGGHPAKVWVERLIKGRAYEAHALTPITELFDLLPDQVYDKFSLGAWRYEYGLSTAGAARFVEEYQRATGFFLDYKRAFGDASDTIIANMYRRAMPRSPSLVIAECLQSDDVVVRTAAELDAEELCASELDESIYPKASHLDPKAAAKIVWAPFVAFFILAVEKPDLLTPLLTSTQKPPNKDQTPKAYSAYSDVENTAIAYFHPSGSRYVDPTGNKDFEGIDSEVFTCLAKAYHHVQQNAPAVKKMLGKARRWLASNGLSGSLFHVFNADWGKANWAHILENIPYDSDMFAPFEAFSKMGAKPSLALKIIQTVSEKATKDALIAYLAKYKDVSVDEVKPAPVSSTKAGYAANDKDTPLSVYGVLSPKDSKQEIGYLGAWDVGGSIFHVTDDAPYDKKLDVNKLDFWSDLIFSGKITNGILRVTALHSDMPGTAFAPSASSAPAASTPTPPTVPLDAPKAPVQVKAEEPAPPSKTTTDPFPQVLTDPDAIKAVKSFLAARFNLQGDEGITNVPFSESPESDVAYKNGVQFGVLSLIKVAPMNTYAYLGLWSIAGVGAYHVLDSDIVSNKVSPSNLTTRKLGGFALDIDGGDVKPTGNVKVLKHYTYDLPVQPEKTSEQNVAAVYCVDSSDLLFVGFNKTCTLLATRKGNNWSIYTSQMVVIFSEYAKKGNVKQLYQIQPSWLKRMPEIVAKAMEEVGIGIFMPPQVSGGPVTLVVDDDTYDVDIATGHGGSQIPQFTNLSTFAGNKIPPLQKTSDPVPKPLDVAQEKPIPVAPKVPVDGGIYCYHDSLFGYVKGGTFYVYAVKGSGEWRLLDEIGQHDKCSFLLSPETKLWGTVTVSTSLRSMFTEKLIAAGVATPAEKGTQYDVTIDGKTYRVSSYLMNGHEVPDMCLLDVETKTLPESVPNQKPTVLYTPPASVFAPSSDEGEDTTNLFGTPAALAYATKKGFTPLKKSDSSLFLWDLGDVRQYTLNGYRTIVGYGDAPQETGASLPVYFILTDEGNISYKSASQGNIAYKLKVGVNQEVIDSLIPVPGSEVLPKLNYKLCAAAKWVSKNYKTVFQPAPLFAHLPGAYLDYKGQKVRLLGWSIGGTGKNTPLLQLNPDDEAGPVKTLFVAADVVEACSIAYSTTFKIDIDQGEIDTSKNIGAPTLIIQGGTIGTFSIDIGPQWVNEMEDETPDAVKEPPFDVIPSKRHLSAGILMVIPSGAGVVMTAYEAVNSSYVDIPPLAASTHWLVFYKPLGEYAGYTYAIPKGTVESGEPILKAAVREVREETGLVAKPLRFLGDYKTSGSITRLYLGIPIKGNPALKKPKHEECDAVVLRKLTIPIDSVVMKAGQDGKKVFDHIDEQKLIAKNPWIKKFVTKGGNTWQIRAICDAATKIFAGGVGLTLYMHPEQADVALPCALPTPSVEPSGQFVLSAKDQEASVKYDGPTSLSYQILPTAIEAVKSFVNFSGMNSPTAGWGYVDYPTMKSFGYPKVGANVSYLHESGPNAVEATVIGYFYLTNGDSKRIRMILRSLKGKPNNFSLGLLSLDLKSATLVPGTTLIPPSAFTLLSMQDAAMLQTSSPKVEPIVTKATEQQPPAWPFWKEVVKSFPFPCTAAAVKQLAATCADTGKIAVSVEGSISGMWNNGEHHSGMIAQSKDGSNKMFVIGYATVVFSDKSSKKYALVQYLDNNAVAAITLDKEIDDAPVVEMGAPMFTHPDPTTNTAIQAFAWGGVKIGPGAMKTYAHEAGVPSWNLVNQNNAVHVATLFTTNCTEPYASNVLATLKSLHKMSKEGKTLSKAVLEELGKDPVSEHQKVIDNLSQISAGWNSPDVWSAVLNAKESDFAKTGSGISKGTKPNATLEGFGKKWFYKWYAGEPFRAEVDKAAALLSMKVVDTVVPVGTLSFNGNYGSIQPMVENPSAVPDKASDLNESQQAAVLAQHVLDMFMGDHDGHTANWLIVEGGRIVPIDRGQAFKPLLLGIQDSLDPYWTMPANSCDAYAKRLLIHWAEGKTEIKASGWLSMASSIENIMAIPTKDISDILAPVFDALKYNEKKRADALKTITARRDSLAKDWTAVLTKLRPNFKWPKAPGEVVKDEISELPGDPKHGLTNEHAKTIKDAASAPVRGKVLKVDTHYIENQDVMIIPVTIKNGSDTIKGTMLRWRFNRDAQLMAVANMSDPAKHPDVQVVTAQGQKLLAFDIAHTGDVWEPLYKAVKTINYHFGTGGKNLGDAAYNVETVSKVLGPQKEDGTHDATKPCVLRFLTDVLTSIKGGTFQQGPDKLEHVSSMAKAYLDFCDSVSGYANASLEEKKSLIGKTLPFINRYEPPADFAKSANIKKSPYAIKLDTSGAVVPDLTEVNGKFVIKDADYPMKNATGHPFATIKMPGLRCQIMLCQMGNTQSDNLGYDGITWALIESETTPATVAKVLRVVQDATGLKTTPATESDKEIAFLAAQLAPYAGVNGVVAPNTYGEVGTVGPLGSMKSLYASGKEKEAIEVGRDALSKATGIPVDKLIKNKAYKPDGDFPNGSGFPETQRVGLTSKDVLKILGPGVHVAHRLTKKGANVIDFMRSISGTGMMLSTNQRPFYGVPLKGETGSQSDDIRYGGSQGIFCVFRDDLRYINHLYFDISLTLRTDVYIVGPKGSWDSYGYVKSKRYMTPESWKAAHNDSGQSIMSGIVEITSYPQVNVRHSIDIRKYLVAAICADKKEVADCIALVKELGWVFADGRTPESIFRTKP